MELVTHGLELRRGEPVLISNLEMAVGPGEIWVVLGPNGSGKSTLLLALAGVLRPTAGEVLLDGRRLSRWLPAERGERIAWQGSLPSAEFGFKVHERLELVPSHTRKVKDALERLDLGPLAGRRLFELSAGERQRVELAALWLRDAPVWLLDEPTTHLDLRHQVSCLDLLREEARNGRSLIVVLHDLTQAHAIADQALLLRADETHQAGPAKELLRPEELEQVFGTRLHVAHGPEESALLPAYHSPDSQRSHE
ncbi:MAG: ABC transporter ATP-binding protein [Deltaproteobacteria bacterium]|nr:ABC transporter ATP-binding protein [Deltaproteobacteria bacterium]MBW2393797.1 ABC transporter ATP-binding protein [Deltaproteobacteria bacterium]